MLRAIYAAVVGLLLTPALALAQEPNGPRTESKSDNVTEAMFLLIIGFIVFLAIVVAFEVRREK